LFVFYLIILFFIRDPRFTNETLSFLQMRAQNPPPQTLEIGAFRQYMEDFYQNGNAKLIETFKGTLEEKIVKTNSTGRFLV
jgi:hypothetical protein